MISIVQIGYGNAARIHRDTCYYPNGWEVIGVVDIDPNKVRKALNEGIPVYSSIDECLKKIERKPDIWDICAPTSKHFEVFKDLVEEGEYKFLIEKPICEPEEVKEFKKLIKIHKPEICVVENYMSSKINQVINNLISIYEIENPVIEIEFTKNRREDVKKGRFLDEKLFVFGYEGPHQLTCVRAIGTGKIKQIKEAKMGDMEIDGVKYTNQGYGEAIFSCDNNTIVNLYTSMEGKIKFGKKSYSPKPDERYRIISLNENEIEILGRYEPIPGFKRGVGEVIISKKDEIIDRKIYEDNHMKLHLERCINYLMERSDENPSPPNLAFEIVEDLYKIVETAKR